MFISRIKHFDNPQLYGCQDETPHFHRPCSSKLDWILNDEHHDEYEDDRSLIINTLFFLVVNKSFL